MVFSERASETFSRLRLPFFLPGVSDSARHGQAGRAGKWRGGQRSERKAPATDFHTKKMFEIRISAI